MHFQHISAVSPDVLFCAAGACPLSFARRNGRPLTPVSAPKSDERGPGRAARINPCELVGECAHVQPLVGALKQIRSYRWRKCLRMFKVQELLCHDLPSDLLRCMVHPSLNYLLYLLSGAKWSFVLLEH